METAIDTKTAELSIQRLSEDLPVDAVIHGKSPEAIRDIPDESIDLVVTDPPYGLSNAKSDKDILKEAIGTFADLVFPDFNEGDIQAVQYGDLIRILSQSSDLRRSKSGAVGIESWVGVPESAVDLNYDIKVRQVEVTTANESSSDGAADSPLVDESNPVIPEFIGDFILDFGDSPDLTSGDVFGGAFSQLRNGFFAMPISAIETPCFPCLEAAQSPIFFGEDFMEDIRRVNDAGSDAKNTSFVLASWRTKRRLILRFDLTGGSAELTNTDRADEADALVEKSGPALVRTGAGTSCLASMFKSTRISFIFSIADRTYTFYFHLWLPPKFTNIIAQLGRTRKGFMGKEWDGQVPSVEVWKECLRVLKPGAFAFILCAPRQDSVSEMIQNLKEAGFVISFSSLFHCFATGFPKSGNLSKLADKRAGKEREVVDVDKSAQRPNAVQAHQEGQSGNFGLKGGGSGLITAPATLEAKALDGSYAGYQPKPAVEIVIVVMRPLAEKTYLDQALANGHGCTQLDAGRIPYEGKQPTGSGNRERGGWRPSGPNEINNAGWTGNDGNVTPPHGRFAPNLLCSDDALNDGSDHKSGAMQYKVHPTSGFGGSENDYGNNSITPVTGNHASSGSYSRYFSLDAWSAKNLPESVNRTFPFLIVPKASKSEKNAGLEGLPDKDMWNGHANQINGSGKPAKQITSKNSHATVKPIKLMSYLIAIGSRPGDVVLDPYAGTCTTGIAAALLDRRYICIEQDADGDGWCDIGRRRIAWHVEQAQAEVSEKYDPEELREARRQYYERHKGEELDVYEVVEGSGTVMGQLDMFD